MKKDASNSAKKLNDPCDPDLWPFDLKWYVPQAFDKQTEKGIYRAAHPS